MFWVHEVCQTRLGVVILNSSVADFPLAALDLPKTRQLTNDVTLETCSRPFGYFELLISSHVS